MLVASWDWLLHMSEHAVYPLCARDRVHVLKQDKYNSCPFWLFFFYESRWIISKFCCENGCDIVLSALRFCEGSCPRHLLLDACSQHISQRYKWILIRFRDVSIPMLTWHRFWDSAHLVYTPAPILCSMCAYPCWQFMCGWFDDADVECCNTHQQPQLGPQL